MLEREHASCAGPMSGSCPSSMGGGSWVDREGSVLTTDPAEPKVRLANWYLGTRKQSELADALMPPPEMGT